MAKEPEIDIYRDTPVRLLGYANEVGEAFRSLTSVWAVRATYGIASLYVLADTKDKAEKMSKLPSSSASHVTKAAIDTLIWQGLASVAVPGFTINRVCAFSLFTLAKLTPRIPLNARKWATTVLGLGTIPFIVAPIDKGVDYFMDHTVRKVLSDEADQDQSS